VQEEKPKSYRYSMAAFLDVWGLIEASRAGSAQN